MERFGTKPKRSKLAIAGWSLSLLLAGYIAGDIYFGRTNIGKFNKCIDLLATVEKNRQTCEDITMRVLKDSKICVDFSIKASENLQECADASKKIKEKYDACTKQLFDCGDAVNEANGAIKSIPSIVMGELKKTLPGIYIATNILTANHYLFEREIANNLVKNVPFYPLFYFSLGGNGIEDCISEFLINPDYKPGDNPEYDEKVKRCVENNFKKPIKLEDSKLGIKIYSTNKLKHVNIYIDNFLKKLKDVDIEDNDKIIKFDELFDYPRSSTKYTIEVTLDDGKKLHDSRYVFSEFEEYMEHLEKTPKK